MPSLSSNKQNLKEKINPLSEQIHEKLAELGLPQLNIQKIHFSLKSGLPDADEQVNWINTIVANIGLPDLKVSKITLTPTAARFDCPDGQEWQYICKGLKCEWKCAPI
jgi:hypothetical protein